MSKVENGAKAATAPKSKYAAKRQARLEQTRQEEKQVLVEEPNEAVEEFKGKKVPADAARFPEHIRNIGICLRYNADLRRFVAKTIINYLRQKGEIDGDSIYVKFAYNKLSVIVNGLAREYYYSNKWFINCYIAGFKSLTDYVSKQINTFISVEMPDYNTNDETQEINKIKEDTDEVDQ